jgi:putative phosphoesterase
LLIGITGDTHNNLKNISKICRIFNEEEVALVIHTGDITLPKSLKAFSELQMPLIGVFGNNDELEKVNLLLESEKFSCSLFEEPHFLNIEDKKICIVHHPNLISNEIIEKVDFIFHGHTHRYRSEIIRKVLIFNPGECAGFLVGKNKVGLVNIYENKSKVISF